MTFEVGVRNDPSNVNECLKVINLAKRANYRSWNFCSEIITNNSKVYILIDDKNDKIVVKRHFQLSTFYFEREIFRDYLSNESHIVLPTHEILLSEFEGTSLPLTVFPYGGEKLESWIHYYRENPKDRLPFTLNVAFQLLSGVACIHRKGISHNDLKPDNILIMGHLQELHLKIIDFGNCHIKGQELEDSTLRSTAPYSPPEALCCYKKGPGVDLYATGVLIFESALCGAFFYNGGTTPLEQIRCSLASYFARKMQPLPKETLSNMVREVRDLFNDNYVLKDPNCPKTYSYSFRRCIKHFLMKEKELHPQLENQARCLTHIILDLTQSDPKLRLTADAILKIYFDGITPFSLAVQGNRVGNLTIDDDEKDPSNLMNSPFEDSEENKGRSFFAKKQGT